MSKARMYLNSATFGVAAAAVILSVGLYGTLAYVKWQTGDKGYAVLFALFILALCAVAFVFRRTWKNYKKLCEVTREIERG